MLRQFRLKFRAEEMPGQQLPQVLVIARDEVGARALALQVIELGRWEKLFGSLRHFTLQDEGEAPARSNVAVVVDGHDWPLPEA